MEKFIIFIITQNGTKRYYTSDSSYGLNLTTDKDICKKYNTFKGCKICLTRLNLWNRYNNIKGFKSLNIEKVTNFN